VAWLPFYPLKRNGDVIGGSSTRGLGRQKEKPKDTGGGTITYSHSNQKRRKKVSEKGALRVGKAKKRETIAGGSQGSCALFCETTRSTRRQEKKEKIGKDPSFIKKMRD